MFLHSWLEFLARERNKKIDFRTHIHQGKGSTGLLHKPVLTATRLDALTVCEEDSGLFTHRVQPVSTACSLPFTPMWELSDTALNIAQPWHIHPPSCFEKTLEIRTHVPGTQTCGCGKVTAHSLRHHSFLLILPQNTLMLSDTLYQR